MASGLAKVGDATTGGFPWMSAILGGIGLAENVFGGNKQSELEDMLFKLAKEGVDVGKLAAPQVGAINKNFAETLTQRLKGIYSQGLGNTSAVEEVPLGFMEAKNQATGQAFSQANAKNESIKSDAQRILSGMNLGSSNQAFGQLAGYGGYNLLKYLTGGNNGQ